MSKEGKWNVNEEGNDEAKLLGRGTSIRGESESESECECVNHNG